MTRTRFFSTLFAAMLLSITAAIAAQIAGPSALDLSWNTIDGGGGTSSDAGSGFELSGTIGQPDASSIAMTAGPAGNEFELTGGFWPGAAGPTPKVCPADIAPAVPDGAVNVLDLLAVIGGWGMCTTPCPPYCTADVNQDCVVNVLDLLAVIGAWGQCID